MTRAYLDPTFTLERLSYRITDQIVASIGGRSIFDEMPGVFFYARLKLVRRKR